MTEKLQLEVVTPQLTIINDLVDSVILPGIEGEMCILPKHVPLLTLMDSGILSYVNDEKSHYIAVHDGYAQVDGNSIKVLTEFAEKPNDIDIERAKKSEEHAKKQLSSKKNNSDIKEDTNIHRKFENKLKRSLVRQKLAEMK